MKIQPLAADSLGVRSMATFVTTADCAILIDPGAALGPRRYGLPPAVQEWEALEESMKLINEYALRSDLLVISHYHYDHYTPEGDFYGGKIIYAKDIKADINRSQYLRGSRFKDYIKNHFECELEYCDNKSYEIGGTKLTFSFPSPHGPEGVRLGFVLLTTIDDGNFRFLHCSDVQGPVSDRTAEYIIDTQPDLIMIDGPPTLFLGWKFAYRHLEHAIANLCNIIDKTRCKVILDHHLVRDLEYKSHLARIYEGYADVQTAAEYLGVENNFLEAHRKELWKGEK
jgi:hypothetical protein